MIVKYAIKRLILYTCTLGAGIVWSAMLRFILKSIKTFLFF